MPIKEETSPELEGKYIIIEELWRIFTYYSLHTDPAQPETLKVANFLKIMKDTQIISKKLTAATIELETTRVVRERRSTTGDESKSANNQIGHIIYNTSTSLSFNDFIHLLDILSSKVYPNESQEISTRRILLENIIPLASRRIPLTLTETTFGDANPFLDQFSKPFQSIFNYYLEKATNRRNSIIASDAAGKKVTSFSTKSSYTSNLKEQMKLQKDLIGYKEFITFCHDFSLKSTSLLTAIQVGEIFLNCVPLDFASKSMKGMSFELFGKALTQLAVTAYRDADSTITLKNKVMGLFLFMWKRINNPEKAADIAMTRRIVSTSHAGSLNLYGSGLFSDTFLSQWQKSGFPDYTTSEKEKGKDGASVLRNIVRNQEKLNENQDVEKEDGKDDESKEENKDDNKNDNTDHDDKVDEDKDGKFNKDSDKDSDASDSIDLENITLETKKIKKGPKVLHGLSIAELFRQRPELGEFVYLEMKALGIC